MARLERSLSLLSLDSRESFPIARVGAHRVSGKHDHQQEGTERESVCRGALSLAPRIVPTGSSTGAVGN